MDPYKILGINQSSSDDEIKKAYRRLASQHHPDKGGDTARFQEIQQAYDTLTDPQRRAQHDNAGNQFHQFSAEFGPGGGFDFDTIFNVFGTRFNFRPPQQARISLWISLQDVMSCPTRTVNVATERGTSLVEITIPPGVEDGTQVNYQGIAPGGIDLLVQFRVHPDARWTRDQNNIVTDVSVSIWQLIVGATVDVTGLTGEQLSVTVPPGTQPNTHLRLRGQGLPNRRNQRGDAIIRIQAVIPEIISGELRDKIRQEIDLR